MKERVLGDRNRKGKLQRSRETKNGGWREEVMREGTKKGRVGQWRAEGTVELRMKIEEGRERKDGKRVRN